MARFLKTFAEELLIWGSAALPWPFLLFPVFFPVRMQVDCVKIDIAKTNRVSKIFLPYPIKKDYGVGS